MKNHSQVCNFEGTYAFLPSSKYVILKGLVHLCVYRFSFIHKNKSACTKILMGFSFTLQQDIGRGCFGWICTKEWWWGGGDRHGSPRRGGGYGRRDTPYGRPLSPLRRGPGRPSPDYGRPCSSVYARYNGPAYDRRRSSDYGRYRRWGRPYPCSYHADFLLYPWYLVLLCNQLHLLFVDISAFCWTAGHLFEGQGREGFPWEVVMLEVEGMTNLTIFCSCYILLISHF